MIPGKRINLWALEPGDMQQNYLWANDPELTKLMGFTPIPRAGTHIFGWLEMINSNPKVQVLAIKLNDCTYIGNLMFSSIEHDQASAEIGIYIGDHRHRAAGYGKEAILTGLRYAYEELRLHRVFARILAYNKTSKQFFRRLGFIKEGVQREGFYTWGRFWDIEVYSMLDREFHKKYPYVYEEDTVEMANVETKKAELETKE